MSAVEPPYRTPFSRFDIFTAWHGMPGQPTKQPAQRTGSGNVVVGRNNGRATTLLLSRLLIAVPPRSAECLHHRVPQAIDDGQQEENSGSARRSG